jgi:hypothetical protein
MIDEAIGKILGMAMAYGVSSLGLFLAYVNYRKRKLRADRVMTPVAWGVVAAIVVVLAGGVAVVASLARPAVPAAPESVAEAAPVPEEATAPAPGLETESAAAPSAATAARPARPAGEPRWPLVGILLPAAIFLLATWVTVGLFRHFSRAAP